MGEFRNRINVTINDQNYTIIGEDSPEHIRYVAHLVDEKLKEMGQNSGKLAQDGASDAILKLVLELIEK